MGLRDDAGQPQSAGSPYAVRCGSPQVDKPAGIASSPDWAPLFAAAGLDPSNGCRRSQSGRPWFHSDARAAWTGSWKSGPIFRCGLRPPRIGASPSTSQLIGPWTRSTHAGDQPNVRRRRSSGSVHSQFFFLSLVVVRCSLTGTCASAGAIAVVLLVWPLLYFPPGWWHGSLARTTFRVLANSGSSLRLWSGGCLVLLHLASLQCSGALCSPPLAGNIVSWSRLLAGDFRDPLVGRDVLLGCFTGALLGALGRFGVVCYRLGWDMLRPNRSLAQHGSFSGYVQSFQICPPH